jgi:hypothetical protein
MKEKYKFGYSDPRAMYGLQAVELEEPEVKWEFLEHHQYSIAAVVVHLIGLAVLMLLVRVVVL